MREAVCHVKEIVPRTVFTDARTLGLNEIHVVPHEVKDPVQPLKARECPREAFPVHGLTAGGEPPLRLKPDSHGHHIVFDGPVPQGVRPRRIVGQHPSQLAHLATGRIGTEHEAGRGQLGIQLVEHDPGLNARPFLLGVHFENPIETRHVQNDARPDGRPREIGPRGTRGQGNAACHGIIHYHVDIRFTFREHHHLWRQAIDAGIDRIRT